MCTQHPHAAFHILFVSLSLFYRLRNKYSILHFMFRLIRMVCHISLKRHKRTMTSVQIIGLLASDLFKYLCHFV